MKRMALLLSLGSVVVGPALAEVDGGMTVEWDGGTIHFKDSRVNTYHGLSRPPIRSKDSAAYGSAPVVDCAFGPRKTKCRQLKAARRDEPYGANLLFMNAVAVVPEDADSPDSNWDEKAKKSPRFIASLPELSIHPVTEKELTDTLNRSNLIATMSETHTYSPVSATIGGEVALSFWKSLIGRKPSRYCYEDDFCSVVLASQWNGNESIAQCEVMNTKVGLGLPFNCNLVAFKRDPEWYVFSYDSPEQCDGCGAVDGANCMIRTQMSVAEIVPIFESVMKKGQTNIKLDIVGHTDSGVRLAGKNIATDSKFFAGYYDKSYAVYTISKESDGKVSISGLFNLLISAEPLPTSTNYRDFGTIKNDNTTQLEWFQDQVLELIQTDLSRKLGGEIVCQVDPIS